MYWKVPVKKIEYSFVIIKSESEPSQHTIENACRELSTVDWQDIEYEVDEIPYEVQESYASEYSVFEE